MNESINDLKAKIQKLRDQYRAESQKAFEEALRDFFLSHPEINSIGWQQYAPYFNDGDVCSFSVHSDSCSINGIDRWDGASDFDDKIYREVGDLIEILDNDVAQELYGNDKQITIKIENGVISTQTRNYSSHD